MENKPWTPTTLLMEDGTVTADPQRLLADLGSKWAAIWKATLKDEITDREVEVYLEELGGKVWTP